MKTLNLDGLQGHKEWLAEVNFLGDLLHPNLVKLIGYCIEDYQRLLVYKFMPRGSLENHLFGRALPLGPSKMKIALGAAKGLAFLHESFVWVPDLRSLDKLLEVGVSPYFSFIPILSTFSMFELNEVVRGRLIGPKAWDRIVGKNFRNYLLPVTAPRLFWVDLIVLL